MNSSVHIDNKGKDILIFCKVPTQGLNNTTLTAETQHSISFTRPGIKFCLSLNFIMLQNYISSKQKTVKYMKKSGLNGCVYDFFVYYKAFNTSNIIDIHKFLMKKMV